MTAIPPAASANIARHLETMAATQPHAAALKVPRGRTATGAIDYLTLTFAELATEVAGWRAHLRAKGVVTGDRVLVMVRQGLPLIASVFALFSLGAIPIVIDPGMGRRRFLECVRRSRPRVLLGIPVAQVLSHLFRRAFNTVEVRVHVSGNALHRIATDGAAHANLEIVPRAARDLAAILFTSGSTGAPKGVCYEHGMFEAQVTMIRDTYGITPGEIDLPMLPVFALFNPALGLTTIVPEIDPSRPATVDPRKIVQAIQQEQVTNTFGSPTLWLKIAQHCRDHAITLPSLRRVLSAGAPVPPALWTAMSQILPNGELHSPYGATEALPVSTIAAREVLAGTADATRTGAGTCVGHIVPPNEVRIIPITDTALASLQDLPLLPAGEIGEIIVRGPTVTQLYDALPEATARAKIPADAGEAADTRNWHRLGDAGYRDDSGRLWFCGRIAERVVLEDGTSLFPDQVEPLFNSHPSIRRTALIAVGPTDRQQAGLVIEPTNTRTVRSDAARRALAAELCQLARDHRHASRVHLFYFHPNLPVDVRHNAKIHRLALARWAASVTGYDSGGPD